jgi:hypothetical protein
MNPRPQILYFFAFFEGAYYGYFLIFSYTFPTGNHPVEQYVIIEFNKNSFLYRLCILNSPISLA